MRVENVFIGAGVSPRSHSLSAVCCSSRIVYASGQFLVVEDVPSTSEGCGQVVSVSDCRHSKPITCLKRVKGPRDIDIFISGGSDGRLILWKLIGNELQHLVTIETGEGSIVSVCGANFVKKLVILASWGEELSGSLKTWTLNTNGSKIEISQTVDLSASLLKKSFVLSMDCHILDAEAILFAVGTSLRKIELYALENTHFIKKLSVVGHTDWIHSVAFNDRDERLILASAGQDTFIKLWRIEECSSEQDENELSVTKNQFSLFISGKEQKMVFNVEAVIGGHEDWVHSTEWNQTGTKLITASSDKSVIIWQEQNELWCDIVRLGIIGGQAAGFFSAVFTEDSKNVIASSYFGGLHCWSAGKDESDLWTPISMSGGHVGEVRDISWSPDGAYLLSVGKDQTTRLFAPEKNTTQFVEVARPQVHGYDMQSIVSISNSCFVSGAEEKIYRAFRAPETFANSISSICNYSKKELFHGQTLETFGARLPALGLSNKAIEASEQIEETVTHWEEIGFQANPSNLTAPPSEDFLQQSTLWPELHKLYGHGFEVYAVACNPSGRVLATACKASHMEHASIILWDIATWAKRLTLPGHQLTVTQIQWSPDGKYLLSVSRDRTAILYTKSGDDEFSYQKVWSSEKEHSRIIWACSWLEDSKHFLTASRDQKVILWATNENSAHVASSIKLTQSVTAITVGTKGLKSIAACGLQDGSLAFIKICDQLKLEEQVLGNSIPIDSAVSRLIFHPRIEGSSGLLAYAGMNGLLRILKISL